MTARENEIRVELLTYAELISNAMVHVTDLLNEIAHCNTTEKYYNVVNGELQEVLPSEWKGLQD